MSFGVGAVIENLKQIKCLFWYCSSLICYLYLYISLG